MSQSSGVLRVTQGSDPVFTPVAPLDAARILQVGTGFWPSKVLLTAVELGVAAIAYK